MTIHFVLTTNHINSGSSRLARLPVPAISGHVTGHMTTSLTMGIFKPVGALDDFALSDFGSPDAIRSRVVSQFGQNDSVWVRPYTVVNQPTDYPKTLDPINDLNSTYLWKRARYVAAGVRYQGVPTTGAHFLDKVQYEPLGGINNLLGFDAATLEGGTTPYRSAATGNSTIVRSTNRAFSGTHSLKITSTNANTATSYRSVPITGMVPVSGSIMWGQARVSADVAGSFTSIMRFYDASFSEIQALVPVGVPHPGDGSWLTYLRQANPPVGAVWASFDVGRTNVNGAGESYYVDDNRVWSNSNTIPSAYDPPRKTILNIQADRINRVRNGSFVGSVRGWAAVGAAAPSIVTDPTVGLSSQNSLKITVPYYTGGFILPWYGVYSTTSSEEPANSNISGLIPGTDYVASVWVKKAPGCPNIYMAMGFDTQFVFSNNYNTVLATYANDPNYVQGPWVRLWSTFKVPTGETGEVRVETVIVDGEQTSGVNSVWWMTDVLCEEGTVPRTFFDGSFGGYDYLWEGSTGWSRSHYYQDRRQKSFRLNEIVKQALPLGSSYEIRYASFVERPNDLPTGTARTHLGDRLSNPNQDFANVTKFVKQQY